MFNVKSLKSLQGRNVLFEEEGGIEPLASVANLVDVMLVFSVALMVALVSFLQVPSLLKNKDYTVITNPGQADMEIIIKEGEEIKHYEATTARGAGRGELLGQAYRLPDGRVVYVPAEKNNNQQNQNTE
ncbi:MAG: DUF2149 domain-containing protein [Planctomycetaceae bacterium]|jgi:hypothetical protein|nr:DUF2149 domain-containing protein [Planctomycetaceae bacterium]